MTCKTRVFERLSRRVSSPCGNRRFWLAFIVRRPGTMVYSRWQIRGNEIRADQREGWRWTFNSKHDRTGEHYPAAPPQTHRRRALSAFGGGQTESRDRRPFRSVCLWWGWNRIDGARKVEIVPRVAPVIGQLHKCSKWQRTHDRDAPRGV